MFITNRPNQIKKFLFLGVALSVTTLSCSEVYASNEEMSDSDNLKNGINEPIKEEIKEDILPKDPQEIKIEDKIIDDWNALKRKNAPAKDLLDFYLKNIMSENESTQQSIFSHANILDDKNIENKDKINFFIKILKNKKSHPKILSNIKEKLMEMTKIEFSQQTMSSNLIACNLREMKDDLDLMMRGVLYIKEGLYSTRYLDLKREHMPGRLIDFLESDDLYLNVAGNDLASLYIDIEERGLVLEKKLLIGGLLESKTASVREKGIELARFFINKPLYSSCDKGDTFLQLLSSEDERAQKIGLEAFADRLKQGDFSLISEVLSRVLESKNESVRKKGIELARLFTTKPPSDIPLYERKEIFLNLLLSEDEQVRKIGLETFSAHLKQGYDNLISQILYQVLKSENNNFIKENILNVVQENLNDPSIKWGNHFNFSIYSIVVGNSELKELIYNFLYKRMCSESIGDKEIHRNCASALTFDLNESDPRRQSAQTILSQIKLDDNGKESIYTIRKELPEQIEERVPDTDTKEIENSEAEAALVRQFLVDLSENSTLIKSLIQKNKTGLLKKVGEKNK